MSMVRILRALAMVIGLAIVAAAPASSTSIAPHCLTELKGTAAADGVVLAQLKSQSGQQASLFCDLCKIQGCGCSGGKCVNCSLTAKPSGGTAPKGGGALKQAR